MVWIPLKTPGGKQLVINSEWVVEAGTHEDEVMMVTYRNRGLASDLVCAPVTIDAEALARLLNWDGK